MPVSKIKPAPYWDEVTLPKFAALHRSFDADVVIVGGGLTGITSAVLLRDARVRVALVERNKVGGIDTGCTSAHLTPVVDAHLDDLVSTLGRDHAQAVWDAGWAAIEQIETLVNRFDIDCDFSWVPGYLHVVVGAKPADAEKDRKRLRELAALASDLEFDASYADQAPLVGTPAMRVEHQAKFHPRKYLRALLNELRESGADVFEETNAEVTPAGVRVGAHEIRAPWIVMATHNPLQGRQSTLQASVLQTRLALYTSYVVRAELPGGAVMPGGAEMDEALFWDTHNPYHYLRIDKAEGKTFAIAGGADHKTGQVDDPDKCYGDVEAWLQQIAPGARVTERWSGQVIETPDGLPYIGEMPGVRGWYYALGYGANGLTAAVIASGILCDFCLGRTSESARLFRLDR